MKVVAFTEIIIFVRVLLGALTFQNSLLCPLIYAHFLRQRYYQSAFTREAFSITYARVDAFVRKPGNPPMVVQVWDKGQHIVQRWVGNSLAGAAPPAAAAR